RLRSRLVSPVRERAALPPRSWRKTAADGGCPRRCRECVHPFDRIRSAWRFPRPGACTDRFGFSRPPGAGGSDPRAGRFPEPPGAAGQRSMRNRRGAALLTALLLLFLLELLAAGLLVIGTQHRSMVRAQADAWQARAAAEGAVRLAAGDWSPGFDTL